ncbi:hypothetical protein INT44_002265, partial [Umbelopsis vinacea]
MECFYELQDQQGGVSMHDGSDGRDSNIMLTTSVSSPETTTISDDGKSMLMGMQLPDYDPFQQHIDSYSLNDFSMPTSQYTTYSEASNLHMMNVQNNGIDFMPEIRSRNQKIPTQDYPSHSSDSFSNIMSQDPMVNFASHVSSNYLPYYTFTSSAQPAPSIKAPETPQYHISPTSYGQFHQAYDAQYRVQQMKQHEMGRPIMGTPNNQLHHNIIQQQPYIDAGLGNGQSWPLTIAKLRQMNMKSNVKKNVGKAKRKRRTAAIVDDPNAPPKPKRNTGLNKPLILSPTLAAFTGVSELSRPEVVKKLWKYIKEKDLQDPTDRRYILCDVELKKIFTQDRVNSFAMNRDLSAHLSKKTDPEPAMTPTLEKADSNYTLVSSSAMTPQTPGIRMSGEEDLTDMAKTEELNAIDIEHLVQSMAP